MPGEIYSKRRLRLELLCLRDVFRALINSLVSYMAQTAGFNYCLFVSVFSYVFFFFLFFLSRFVVVVFVIVVVCLVVFVVVVFWVGGGCCCCCCC